MANHKFNRDESGNAVVITLVVLALVAVGGFAYMSGKQGGLNLGAIGDIASTDNDSVAVAGNTASADENPILVKLDGADIRRQDVIDFINTMPGQIRQQVPPQQLFSLALEQMVGNVIVDKKAAGSNLKNDADVKAQVAKATDQIIRAKFIENAIDENLSDERIKAAYENYLKNFPEVEEVRAAHILVDDEAVAKDIIAKLNKGGSFADLAKEFSKDGSSANGGDLGYFTAADVVPEFSKAAFSQDVGSFSKSAVKSDFGYHIVRVDDKRKRPPAEFDAAKSFLEQELRQTILQEVVASWKEGVDIERFDINGKPLSAQEPAAGEPVEESVNEEAVEESASEEPAAAK